MIKQLFLICAILFLVYSTCRADLQGNRAQLEKIRQRIENTQVDLAEKKQEELDRLRDLALLKQTMRRIERRIADLQKEQLTLEKKIAEQQDQVEAGQRSIRSVERRVEKRLQALYKDGEIGPLRVLFSADTPTELAQQYQYLTKVLEADQALLAEYRTALQKQQQELAVLENLRQEKQQLLANQKRQREDADEARRLQSQLLAKVRTDKQQLNRELAELKEKAARLQGLVSRLKQETPSAAVPGAASFTAGKGKLAWPLNGAVLIGFGTQKDADLGTIYESNGIEIAAAQGSAVRAVADGRVVFADWFKGYGNLLIISHAGGYHTLYAQAARLEKRVGDQVKAGEVIGHSGLSGREGIYFEIRYNGSPVDPLDWLQRR